MIFKRKKIEKLNKLLDQGIRAKDFSQAKADCNDAEVLALLEAGEKLQQSAHLSNKLNPESFQADLQAKLLAMRDEKNMKSKSIKSWWENNNFLGKPHFALQAVSLLAVLILLVVGGFYFSKIQFWGSKIQPIPLVQAGQGNVPVSIPIRFEFPYPQAILADLQAGFSIEPKIDGQLQFDAAKKILTFEHERNLRYNTPYTIKIASGTKVAEQNTLTTDFNFTFNTRNKGVTRELFYNSSYGTNVYTLNYYDNEYQIPIVYYGQQDAKYSFNIYKSNFEDLQDSYYNSGKWDEKANKYVQKDYKNKDFIESQIVTLSEKDRIYKPNLKETGIYFVEVHSAEKSENFQFFIVLTKTVTNSYRLGDKLVTWVVDQKTSAGVSQAKITAYADAPEKIMFAENTNDQGLLEKTFTFRKPEDMPSIIKIENQGDIGIFLLQWSNITYSDYNYDLKPAQAYIYTDRPIYRAGDTVNFKSIIWENNNSVYKPSDKEYQIIAREKTWGEQANIIYQKTINPNGNGSSADSFQLSKEIKTGQYELVMMQGDTQLNALDFFVEFYQKPEFEIKIATDKETYIKGQTINAKINSSYFFGQPLPNAKVNVNIYTYNNYYWRDKQDFQLDKQGNLNLAISTSDFVLPDWGWYMNNNGVPVTIEATVTDSSGSTSTNSYTLNMFDGEYSIDLKEPADWWNIDIDKDYNFIVEAKDHLTKEYVKQLPLKVKVSRHNYDYKSGERAEEIVYEDNLTTDVTGEITFNLKFSKPGSYEMRISGQDSLRNEIVMTKYLYVYGKNYYGYNDPNWLKESADKITVKADKETYNIGETAHFEITYPRPEGQVFWSINQKTLRKYEVKDINSAKQIDIKITADLTPGFYLYFNFFQDEQFLSQAQLVKVNGKKIDVQVAADKASYLPGENATLTLKTASEGKPVAAEASLGVIDKAILALKDEQAGDIYKAMYPDMGNYLASYDSLTVIFWGGAEMGCFTGETPILMADGRSYKQIKDIKIGDQILTKQNEYSSKLVATPVEKTFQHEVNEYLIINNSLKITPVHRVWLNGQWQEISQAKIGDWLVDKNNNLVKITAISEVNAQTTVYNLQTAQYHTFIADNIYVHNEKGGGSEVRSNFVDTAYWNPLIATNNRGEAQISLKLPDNLTTWVASAKAVNASMSAGQGMTEIKTSKKLIVRPNLPQFFRIDDKIYIKTSVHNYTGDKNDFTVSLQADGAKILSDNKKTISLGNNESVTQTWYLQISDTTKVDFTFSAKQNNGNNTDTVKLSVPVYPNLSLYKNVINGFGPTEKDFSFEPTALPKYAKATLSITPSVASSLPDIIKKLTGYPYGCVEQTMSKHLPNILAVKNNDILKIELSKDIQAQLTDGFDRLVSFQQDNGSFGWWSDDYNIWITGYILEGLYEAKTANLLSGRAKLYNKTLEFIKANIEQVKGPEKVYTYYLLSKIEPENYNKPIADLAATVLKNPTDYDTQSIGYMALAAYNAGQTQNAKDLLKLSLDKISNDHWEDSQQTEWYYWAMRDRFSTTGVNLMALIKIDPTNSNIPNIVRWLMSNRDGYEGLWGSTRQSAQILYALIEYLKTSQELRPDYNYTVLINNIQVKADKISASDYTAKIDIPLDKLANNNSLKIEQNGTGNIYWTLTLYNYLPAANIATYRDSGLKVERTYTDLQGNEVTKFKEGDLVFVKIHVSGNSNNQYYAIIEDYLPAGFVTVNKRLDNVVGNEHDYYWGYYDYNFIDYRDEKVSMFKSYLNWGYGNDLTYLVRVGFSGEFQSPSAYSELMYSPQEYGFSDYNKIKVE